MKKLLLCMIFLAVLGVVFLRSRTTEVENYRFPLPTQTPSEYSVAGLRGWEWSSSEKRLIRDVEFFLEKLWEQNGDARLSILKAQPIRRRDKKSDHAGAEWIPGKGVYLDMSVVSGEVKNFFGVALIFAHELGHAQLNTQNPTEEVLVEEERKLHVKGISDIDEFSRFVTSIVPGRSWDGQRSFDICESEKRSHHYYMRQILRLMSL